MGRLKRSGVREEEYFDVEGVGMSVGTGGGGEDDERRRRRAVLKAVERVRDAVVAGGRRVKVVGEGMAMAGVKGFEDGEGSPALLGQFSAEVRRALEEGCVRVEGKDGELEIYPALRRAVREATEEVRSRVDTFVCRVARKDARLPRLPIPLLLLTS